MMRITPYVEQRRIITGPMASDKFDGCNGAFVLVRERVEMHVVLSEKGGWDHVFVSCKKRCPKWEEMCWIKNLIFNSEDVVIQYHPKKSEYIYLPKFCLHLWRPQNLELPSPTNWMV